MSILRVNEIRSQAGTTIEVPSGYSLKLDQTTLDTNSLPPPISGNSGKFLKSDGTNIGWESVGPNSIVTFTGNGTYYPSAGVTKVWVKLVGGGGAGSGVGECGGAGGYAEKMISMVGVSQVSITIGLGSTASTQYPSAAGAGGTTSFGSYLSATGGRGGNSSHQHCGGYGGVGSGGDVNLYGGGGPGHQYWAGPTGGASYFGGSGPSGYPNGGTYAKNNSAFAAYGAGGAAGYHSQQQGAFGKDGVVVIWEFK